MTTSPSFTTLVPVDDHILEPPTLWSEGLPTRYREQGPRLVRERVDPSDPDRGWHDVWYYEDFRMPLRRVGDRRAPGDHGRFPSRMLRPEGPASGHDC